MDHNTHCSCPGRFVLGLSALARNDETNANVRSIVDGNANGLVGQDYVIPDARLWPFMLLGIFETQGQIREMDVRLIS